MDHEAPVAAFVAPRGNVEYVYGEERETAISRRARMVEPSAIVAPDEVEANAWRTSEVEVIFSTWGMPSLTEDQLDRCFPRLKAVFYAAGSVQLFAAPLLGRGVKVVSAWRANAVSVAQFTVAQIVLSMKGYFRNEREYDGSEDRYRNSFSGRGVYGETVGLLGAGAIGRLVIEMLRAYDVKVIVWDPFLDAPGARALGVEKVETLSDLFSRSYVISNHLADKDETAGLLDRDLFDQMRPNATFVNTGRGRTVDEPALVQFLTARRDVTALLDVTHPEPPGVDGPIMKLPNALVTSHIAGTIGDEVRRMADLCIREFDRYLVGAPLHHEVTLDVLRTMA